MNVDKTKIFLSYIALKSSMYIWDKRQDLQSIYDLFLENQYIASIERIFKFTIETIEYVVQINL